MNCSSPSTGQNHLGAKRPGETHHRAGLCPEASCRREKRTCDGQMDAQCEHAHRRVEVSSTEVCDNARQDRGQKMVVYSLIAGVFPRLARLLVWSPAGPRRAAQHVFSAYSGIIFLLSRQ